MAEVALNIAAFVLGMAIALGTLFDAAMTTIHPWPHRSWLATLTFRAVYLVFRVPLAVARTRLARRRWLGIFGPLALVFVPFAWFFAVTFGFALVFWSLGAGTLLESLIDSGSALSTLGFDTPSRRVDQLVAIVGGAIGLGLIAFWITFLPGIVAVGTQRDALVSQFSLIAGTPPSAMTVLETFYAAQQAERLADKWVEWTNWFVLLRDTHTQLPVVSAVRSVRPKLSWVATAGAILDAAALTLSTIDRAPDFQVTLCLRAGIAALADIEAALQTVVGRLPHHTAPETSRAAFDAACDRLAGAGVPLTADREQALRDFRAWRAQYAPGLDALAQALAAPLDAGIH